MRIVSYNLFEGALDTISLLQDFVRQQDADILCIQEATSWNDGEPTTLEAFALATGLNFYVYGH